MCAPQYLQNIYKPPLDSTTLSRELRELREWAASITVVSDRRNSLRPIRAIRGSVPIGYPISRLKKIQILRLTRSRLRLVIVNPTHERRQAHQDRFSSTPRFQPEDRAAVIKKIELHVPSPAIQLVFAFAFSIR